MGSSRTRDRTRVSCIGRRILNHCATREVPERKAILIEFVELEVSAGHPGGGVQEIIGHLDVELRRKAKSKYIYV